jgi:phosphoesterase RecJ-like protein
LITIKKPDDYAAYSYSTLRLDRPAINSFLEKKEDIDKTIGTCIYTGILTDSGSFRFPGTTGNTHRIVSELIDLGVENTKIPSLLFENSSYSRLQLLGRALQNLKVLSNHKLHTLH